MDSMPWMQNVVAVKWLYWDQLLSGQEILLHCLLLPSLGILLSVVSFVLYFGSLYSFFCAVIVQPCPGSWYRLLDAANDKCAIAVILAYFLSNSTSGEFTSLLLGFFAVVLSTASSCLPAETLENQPSHCWFFLQSTWISPLEWGADVLCLLNCITHHWLLFCPELITK